MRGSSIGVFWRAVDWYRVTSPCVLKSNSLIYSVRFASDHRNSPPHSHRALLLHIYLREKKCDKKAFIGIESQRSTTENKREENLSYTARRNVLTCVLPRDPKHSPLSPTAPVSVIVTETGAVGDKGECFGSRGKFGNRERKKFEAHTWKWDPRTYDGECLTEDHF